MLSNLYFETRFGFLIALKLGTFFFVLPALKSRYRMRPAKKLHVSLIEAPKINMIKRL